MKRYVKMVMCLLILIISVVSVNAGILDDLNTTLTQEEEEDLTEAMAPIGKLIGALQWIFAALALIAIIYGAFLYLTGDPINKTKAIAIIVGAIVAGVIIYAAPRIIQFFGFG